MPFQLFRDGGKWSGYESPSGGPFATKADLVAEVRRLQKNDLQAARVGVEAAKRKLREAEEALSEPVRVDGLAPPEMLAEADDIIARAEARLARLSRRQPDP